MNLSSPTEDENVVERGPWAYADWES